MFVHLTPEQQALTIAMGEISEEAYCAGWMVGLEYALWHLLVNGKTVYGRYTLSEEDRRKLLKLSEQCGGWIIFDEKNEETFIPLTKWKVMFRADASKYRLE